jgi:hypothetical protein
LIKELRLKTFLITHHGIAPFTEFAILITYMMNLYNNYLGNSPITLDPAISVLFEIGEILGWKLGLVDLKEFN